MREHGEWGRLWSSSGCLVAKPTCPRYESVPVSKGMLLDQERKGRVSAYLALNSGETVSPE